MKCKTTAKAIRQGFNNILRIGYCDMQRLLSNRSAQSYYSGTYGWNFDVYDVSDILPGTCIATGYRGMPNTAKKVDYTAILEAEKQAKNLTFDARESLLRDIILSRFAKK